MHRHTMCQSSVLTRSADSIHTAHLAALLDSGGSRLHYSDLLKTMYSWPFPDVYKRNGLMWWWKLQQNTNPEKDQNTHMQISSAHTTLSACFWLSNRNPLDNTTEGHPTTIAECAESVCGGAKDHEPGHFVANSLPSFAAVLQFCRTRPSLWDPLTSTW